MAKNVSVGKLFYRRKRLAESLTAAEVQFAYRLNGGRIKFKSQYVIPPYIVDFLIPNRMLIIELDGSHHLTGEQKAHDERRARYLESKGFNIIRILNQDAKLWPLKNIRKYPKCKGTRIAIEKIVEEFKQIGMKRGPRRGTSQATKGTPF